MREREIEKKRMGEKKKVRMTEEKKGGRARERENLKKKTEKKTDLGRVREDPSSNYIQMAVREDSEWIGGQNVKVGEVHIERKQTRERERETWRRTINRL